MEISWLPFRVPCMRSVCKLSYVSVSLVVLFNRFVFENRLFFVSRGIRVGHSEIWNWTSTICIPSDTRFYDVEAIPSVWKSVSSCRNQHQSNTHFQIHLPANYFPIYVVNNYFLWITLYINFLLILSLAPVENVLESVHSWNSVTNGARCIRLKVRSRFS